MKQPPLVSIVTPCLNAAAYIEQTIESVLSQDYPNLEYIVMDGGSLDGTVEILERLSGRLTYVSAPDRGAADAINRGFERSHGEIFAWLSADDRYLPGAVRTAVERLAVASEAAVVYGEAHWEGERGEALGRYPTMLPYRASMFAEECGICQPACFIRRTAFADAGMLDESLLLAYDYDLWIRMSRQYEFVAMPECVAVSRMHRSNKSLGQKRGMFEENIALLRRHYGYVPVKWVYGYLSYLRDGRDQFFEPLQRSPLVYLASLVVGSVYNRRCSVRYWREWLSGITSHVSWSG